MQAIHITTILNDFITVTSNPKVSHSKILQSEIGIQN